MLFWLKKVISFWLMPLPFCLLLFGVGALLLRRPKHARRGKILIGTAMVWLALTSHGWFSGTLVRSLERRYPAIPEFSATSVVPAELRRCRYVVVLGGGNGNDANLPALSQLSPSALGRITEGVRLLRALPDARLLVSGPGPAGEPTHAERLTRAAVALGVEPSRIDRIETGRDTEEEAAATKGLVGQQPVALVTSAWHMPRAAGLFRQAGVDALPCPADYLLKSRSEGWAALWSWSPENLQRSTWVMHERFGQLWLWLRGKS